MFCSTHYLINSCNPRRIHWEKLFCYITSITYQKEMIDVLANGPFNYSQDSSIKVLAIDREDQALISEPWLLDVCAASG